MDQKLNVKRKAVKIVGDTSRVITQLHVPDEKYRISKIIARIMSLSETAAKNLITPHKKEREEYVPNVVYSCGAIIHNNELVIPYAMSDINSGIATVEVENLIDCMHTVS